MNIEERVYFLRRKLKTGLVFIGMAAMLAGCGQGAGAAAEEAPVEE